MAVDGAQVVPPALTPAAPTTLRNARASASRDPAGAVVLVPVGERERVAVDGEVSHDRVTVGLRERGLGLNIVALPRAGELKAGFAQFVDEPGHRRVGRVAYGGRSKRGDDVMAELHGVRDSVQRRVAARGF